MSYIYLASPYTHPLKSMMASRFEAVMDATVRCAKAGVPVYSPIVHWHIPALTHRLPHTEEFWRTQNAAMLAGCRELWVLAIAGWNDSTGVAWEISQVSRSRVPVIVTPDCLELFCKSYLDRQESTNARSSQA